MRKEVARIQLTAAKAQFEADGDRATAPSHGIGVAPGGETLWGDRHSEQCGLCLFAFRISSSPGEVLLPSLKLPGHEPISAIAN